MFARHVDRLGYSKATLDEVAKEMRISKKTIYVYFDGKRDIYEFIVEQRAQQERMRLRAFVQPLPNAREKVAALLWFAISAGRAHIEETTETDWTQEFEVAADAFRKAHGDLLREFVEEGMAAREFAQGDSRLVEKMVGAMMLEYLVVVNADTNYNRDEELVERILRFIG